MRSHGTPRDWATVALIEYQKLTNRPPMINGKRATVCRTCGMLIARSSVRKNSVFYCSKMCRDKFNNGRRGYALAARLLSLNTYKR